MNNSTIFNRFDFVTKGMLTKQEPDTENKSLIAKFKFLNKVYDNFLLDKIIVGNSTISINGDIKFSMVAKEVVEYKKNYMLSSVVAITKNNVIGANDRLPWGKQKSDMKRFVALTKGHTVIVGRKTFNTFGNKPLKERFHIIITNDLTFKVADEYKDQCLVVNSIQGALNHLDKMSENVKENEPIMKAFVIGGGEIYQQFMKYVDNIFLTKIMITSIDGDTFFPTIDMNDFNFSENEVFPADEDNQSPYHFRLYVKSKSRNRKKEISSGIVKQILYTYYLEKM
jgi:dihydrofolate reductase